MLNENNNCTISRNCCECIIDCIANKEGFIKESHAKCVKKAIKEIMENKKLMRNNKPQELKIPENESTQNHFSLSDSR